MKYCKTYKNLTVTINTVKLEDIVQIHKICDRDFIPQLSSRVNIEEYSLKLFKNAEKIGLFDGDNLIGFLAIYCNDLRTHVAFISSVCVIKEYRGKGIGKVLLNEAIKIAKRKSMKKIKLEVSPQNYPAINLYKNFGYDIVAKSENSLFMERNAYPQVSILCVTYNHEKYISQAIEGFLMQKTIFDYEIVIGEDCSTDNTRSIILDYKKRYPDKIKLLLHKKNVGAMKNFIDTLNLCHGKYIALCEGDDYWIDPYKLQKQVDFLESKADYGMVHGDVDHLYQSSGKLIRNYNRTKKIKIPEGNIFEELLCTQSHLIKTMTVCCRKELIDRYFNFKITIERNWQLLDLPLWLEIAKHSKIHYINESLATYRLLEESLSRTNDIKRLHKFHKSVYDIRFYYWEKYSKKYEIKEKLERDYHIMLLGDAYRMNDIELATNAFRYFKERGIKLPIKHKAKYWALKNSLCRSFLDTAIKMKRYLT